MKDLLDPLVKMATRDPPVKKDQLEIPDHQESLANQE